MFRPSRIILLGILAALVWLRTWRLLLLPMFYDEGLHITRGQYILANHTLLTQTVGGKYLQVWLLALVFPFAGDPLLAARALSAAFGFLAGIGCYLLARQLYQREDVALLATAMYAIAPYPLFFDRMTLAEGVLSALGIWCLLFSLVAVRQGRWWQILGLGLCLGAAAATKLNGLAFAGFPLLAAWLGRDNLPRRRILLITLAAWLLVIPWLLPAAFDFIYQYDYLVSRSWIGSEMEDSTYLTQFSQNFDLIAGVLWHYLTPPFLALVLVEVGRSLWRRDKSTWLLALAGLATLALFFLVVSAGDFYPRYLVPAFPFLLILAARGLAALTDWLWEHRPRPTWRFRWGLLAGLALLASLFALRFDYLLLTDPPSASWMPIDRWQTIDGWPAGYGVIDAAAYLRQQADELGAIVVVKRARDRMYTGNWVHYLQHPGISITATNFENSDLPGYIEALRNKKAPIFVILDRPREDKYVATFTKGAYAPYSTLVGTFSRPGGASYIEVYRLKFVP